MQYLSAVVMMTLHLGPNSALILGYIQVYIAIYCIISAIQHAFFCFQFPAVVIGYTVFSFLCTNI